MITWNLTKMLILAAATCAAIGGSATADAPQPDPPAGQEAAQGALSATVRSEQAEFRTNERLRFIVTFANASQEDVALEVQDFLGCQTAGKYTPVFRDVATGDKWQFRFMPAGAPVRLLQQTVKAGGTLDLPYPLPGTFAKEDGTRANHLPVGKYELALTIEANGQTLTPKPAAFAMTTAPVAKVDNTKAIAQAREALATTLAKYAKSEEQTGQSNLPGGNAYAKLKAEQFAAEVTPGDNMSSVKFSYELPNTDRILRWSASVGENGVHPSFQTTGFMLVQARQGSNVRPIEPR